MENMAHVSFGVTENHKCKFNMACYGEICICNEICLKEDSELTDEEIRHIEEINADATGYNESIANKTE